MTFSDSFKEFHNIRVNDNILLRQHVPENDAKDFYDIYKDQEAFKYFDGYKYPGEQYTEQFIKVLESRIKGFKGKRDYSWVIDFNGKVIGQIQVFNFENSNTYCEMGYFIKREYWNQGINTKCIKSVAKFVINSMGFERIEAFANVKNHASNRSLEKAGFHKEGCLRKRSYLGKQFHDVNVWSLIREDIDIL